MDKTVKKKSGGLLWERIKVVSMIPDFLELRPYSNRCFSSCSFVEAVMALCIYKLA